jgi:hypothetical protein
MRRAEHFCRRLLERHSEIGVPANRRVHRAVWGSRHAVARPGHRVAPKARLVGEPEGGEGLGGTFRPLDDVHPVVEQRVGDVLSAVECSARNRRNTNPMLRAGSVASVRSG